VFKATHFLLENSSLYREQRLYVVCYEWVQYVVWFPSLVTFITHTEPCNYSTTHVSETSQKVQRTLNWKGKLQG